MVILRLGYRVRAGRCSHGFLTIELTIAASSQMNSRRPFLANTKALLQIANLLVHVLGKSSLMASLLPEWWNMASVHASHRHDLGDVNLGLGRGEVAHGVLVERV